MLGPVAYQRQVLKRRLWSQQETILNAIHTHRSVSIAGCHGSGKTFLVSGYVPYQLQADPESIVLTIAPTLRQVKTHWNEITTAINRLRSVVKLPEPSTTVWKLGPNNYAQGFSSSKGVNAQGYHAKRITLIVDEAIGLTPDLWDSLEGIRSAGDVRTVKLCNPTVPSGPVYEDFTRLRGVAGHKTFNISAFDTPNLAGLTLETLLALPDHELDYAPFPSLIRRRWVVEMFHKWGPLNPRFLSRVLGQFPTQATDAVFQLEWIERAALDYEPEDLAPLLKPGVFIQVGIDVAGPGDDETTICARIGSYVVAADAWVKADAVENVLAFLGKLHQRFPGAAVIILGDIVGPGFHFLTQIRRAGYDVRGFNAGGTPVDGTMFRNAKAEAYWQLREWMRQGHVHGLADEDTKAQLSDVRYRELPNGLIEIEHKDEARARGSSSPDRAEAAIMAFARLVPRVQEFQFTDPQFQISPV